MTVKVNGEVREIPNTVGALHQLIAAQGLTTFQAGEKIYNIGEISQAQFTNIINQIESRTSRYLKIFLYVFVPVVAIAFAVLYVRNQRLQEPLVFSVTLDNRSPSPELPFETGKVTLLFDGEPKSKEVIEPETEAIFKGIPANFRGKRVAVHFEAEGFVKTDTAFILSGEHLLLPIRRDSSLAKIFGIVKDDGGLPLAEVEISVQNLTARTEASGRFMLPPIPFAQQRKAQRIRAFKPGYQPWDNTSPVIANEEIAIILHH